MRWVEQTRWDSPRGHEVYEYEGKKFVMCHADVAARDLSLLNLGLGWLGMGLG